jgi:excisionase family DNA binding protein
MTTLEALEPLGPLEPLSLSPPGPPRRSGPRTPDPGGEWLSLTQAAAYLGVNPKTVDYYTHRRGAQLRTYWVGRTRRRFRRSDLDAWKRDYLEPRAAPGRGETGGEGDAGDVDRK